MKKLIFGLIAIVFVLSLTACNNIKTKTNIISETQLTDREKVFLSAGNNQYFVFNFSVDDTYKWVKVWVERYEFGGKASNSSELSAALSENKEGMILAEVSGFEKMKNNWTIVIDNGGATSIAESSQEYKTVEDTSYSKVWGTNNSKDISINDNEILLSSICYEYINKSNSISSLTDEFYNNPDENINEIANYDLVYLLKCKFYKNIPSK